MSLLSFVWDIGILIAVLINTCLSNNKPMGLYMEGPIFTGRAYIRNDLSVSEYGGLINSIFQFNSIY
jgi:hypothetical protein